MASHTSVFDDLDDLTAQMCISMYLEDIATFPSQVASSNATPSDETVALQILEADLKAYRVLRGYEEPPIQPVIEEAVPEILPQPLIKIALFDCAACGERFDAEHSVRVPCNHCYCDRCLDDLFTHAMSDRTLYPPRCCRQIIPWDSVSFLVSNELATKFEAKQEELDDKTPVYCHNKRCSNYIKANVQDPTKATCSTCDATTCTLCKQAAHDGACPEDKEVQKMREYAKAEGNQECGQCGQLVELSTGCNHMTCLCKYQFCYCCGVEWKNCPCQQWDETRLIARADDVANRPGMGGALNAAAIAERLRRNVRDCDEDGHGYMEKRNGRIRCDGCGMIQARFIFRCYHCHMELCYRCKNNRA